jgi:hypothetical protein
LYETQYKIERKLGDDGAWVEIGTEEEDAESYTDYGISPYQKYWYRVRAYDGRHYSDYSNEVYEYAIPMWSDGGVVIQ